MSTPFHRSRRRTSPATQLIVAVSVVLGGVACGTTEFAAGGDASVDGSTAPDAKHGADTGHKGSDSGRDAAGKDAKLGDGGKHDTSTSHDTGTSSDTGGPHDTGTPADTGTGHDSGHDSGNEHDSGHDSGNEHDSGHDSGNEHDSGHDGGHDSGGPSCSGAPCTSVATCPGPTPPNECKTATCAGECCGLANIMAHTPCMNGTSPGVCNGSGACVGCLSTIDCPVSDTLCATYGCMAGTCARFDEPEETTCSDNGGHVCNGSGTCVGCNTIADCATGIPDQCETLSCMGNLCGQTPTQAGAPCGTAGSGYECNGMGACCGSGGGPCILGM